MAKPSKIVHGIVRRKIRTDNLMVRINADLLERCQKHRQKDGLTWREIIESCLSEYLAACEKKTCVLCCCANCSFHGLADPSRACPHCGVKSLKTGQDGKGEHGK